MSLQRSCLGSVYSSVSFLLKLKPYGAAAVQEQVGQQMQEQQAWLESLQWTLADARRLVGAVGAVESYGPSKTALQVCSKSVSFAVCCFHSIGWN